MSDFTAGPSRRRRSDALRSASAVLDAATEILGRHPDAGIDDIAKAAGVSRQTVYAHFASRERLITAVVERITQETAAAIDAARLDDGSATDALLRFLDAAWRVLERYPLLQQLPPNDSAEDVDLHRPILGQLTDLVERGQASGEFDAGLSVDWLLAATIALGHAAGGEVTAGRMSFETAASALRHSVLRLYGAG